MDRVRWSEAAPKASTAAGQYMRLDLWWSDADDKMEVDWSSDASE
jgi:muramidase (phage lysozyme)